MRCNSGLRQKPVLDEETRDASAVPIVCDVPPAGGDRACLRPYSYAFREARSMPIKSLIRTIAHYPKPGIMFRDITTLLKDPEGFRLTIERLAERYLTARPDKIAGIESRGFIIGAALAFRLGTGFVPIRKKGKLPGQTFGYDYELEYGADRVEMHVDAIERGESVLLVDDLIATGGTAEAAAALIEQAGGTVSECCFVIDLPEIGGSRRLAAKGYRVFSLCEFEGE
jgi:adenine phosphoribosyltransferase